MSEGVRASASSHRLLASAVSHPEGRGGKAGKSRAISKQAIFHYVYAALHDPVYRETYAQNLKREFPRIPLYGATPADFWRWADWGERLMALHVGYESVEPWPLGRVDIDGADGEGGPSPQPCPGPAQGAGRSSERDLPLADRNGSLSPRRERGASPKALLKSDPDSGRIVLDSETTLTGIPPEAWRYRLGNRSALDWVLDQHKERKPKDPTIRERFDTYRFADHKARVIDRSPASPGSASRPRPSSRRCARRRAEGDDRERRLS